MHPKTGGGFISVPENQLGYDVYEINGQSNARGNGAIRSGIDDNYTGLSHVFMWDGSSGYLIYGAQVEAGAFPTSYIETGTSGSSTTRSADVCQITGSDFSGFWNGTEGTLAFDADGFSTSTDNQFITSISSGSVSNSINLVRSNANDVTGVGSSVLAGGVLQEAMNAAAGTMPSNISCKLSFAYKANDFAQSVNSAAVTTDTSGSIPTVSQMVIGNAGWTTGPLNGHIARLRYFNKRLPNATLQQLSDPDPTLNLQFALNKTLTPVAGPAPSFSRASTGTYFNASGVLTSASINTPRFDHVYSGGQWVSKGLLVEEQRTNISLNSEDISNIYWNSFSGQTVTSDQAVAPDGTNTADRLQIAGTGWFGRQNNYLTGTYTYSVWLKSDSPTQVLMRFTDNAGTYTVAQLVNVTTTWQRFSLTQTFGAGSFTYLFWGFDQRSVVGGPGTACNVYAWGIQVESGSFPTSYIPTTSSSVVRSADVCQITGTSFNWMWNQGEGSVAAEFDYLNPVPSGIETAFLFNNTTSESERIWFSKSNASPYGQRAVFTASSSNVAVLSVSDSLPSSNQFYKTAAGFKLND